MKIWIPEKHQIEILLQTVLDKSGAVNEVEAWIDDELCCIQSHVANRAAMERGEISEGT